MQKRLFEFMAGIYIHIPFCKTRCHYCNFFSMASQKYKSEFIHTLLAEIVLQKDYLDGQKVNTIYFGGGTPSLMSATEIETFLQLIRKYYNVQSDAEITLEANPDDVSVKWLEEIRNSTSVNRFSLGVQSFHDKDLAYLNRIHSGADAEKAIHYLQEEGFSNLSIDLIYGIPGLTDEDWLQNMHKFFELDIPHLSAYSLTIEEKTPLYQFIVKGKVQAPDETESIGHFKSLLASMEQHDFIHYEISNFAKEGYYSKHNSLYWTGGHYLGLGPSAHSYNGKSRRWNKPSLKAWLSLKEYYGESFEEEVLGQDERYNEYVMTSLRTIWGCDIDVVRNEFGHVYADLLLRGADQYIQENKLELRKNRLFLTNKGKLFADGIASDLFR